MARSIALAVVSVMAAAASETRFARVGEAEGTVEVRANAADQWRPALRNLAVTQGAQIRTGAVSRVEVELDDGSVLRLGPESTAEFCDYVRLSTGQRISLLALDRGLAYFTGEPGARDSVSLVIPGGQIAFRSGARVRLEASGDIGQVAALEGDARLLIPAAEFDLRGGQTARVTRTQGQRFELYREVGKMDLDEWSERRDRALSASRSSLHAPHLRYGMADLDAHGTWIETAEFGPAWKPAVPPDWAPFRTGKWIWHDALGYTWVGAELWGWLPYHYGRWMRLNPVGWLWAPGGDARFRPGEVYWMRGTNIAGWGPLAAGESWNGTSVPQLYLNAHTTFAKFQAGMREIDPDGFTARPRDPLAAAQFTWAPVSPPLLPHRETAALRAGEVRFLRPDPRYEVIASTAEPAPAPELPAEQTVAEAPPEAQAIEPQGFVTVPVPQLEETYYTAPVYTGVIVVNPPDRHGHRRRRPAEPEKPAQPAQPTAPAAPPQAPAPRQTIPRTERREAGRSPQPAAQPAPPSGAVPRSESRVPRAEQGSAGRRQQ